MMAHFIIFIRLKNQSGKHKNKSSNYFQIINLVIVQKTRAMKSIKLYFSFFALFTIALFYSCEATLAPAYDQAIVEKVTASSDLAMRFFAEVDGGTESESFAVREPVYNILIGSFESLEIQARARPEPKNVALDKINEMLQAKGSNSITGEYPSAFAFEKIAETFKKMKETDRQNGVKPLALHAFKGQVEIYLDQALTYESFLKR